MGSVPQRRGADIELNIHSGSKIKSIIQQASLKKCLLDNHNLQFQNRSGSLAAGNSAKQLPAFQMRFQ